jgi:hypothetical protein
MVFHDAPEVHRAQADVLPSAIREKRCGNDSCGEAAKNPGFT